MKVVLTVNQPYFPARSGSLKAVRLLGKALVAHGCSVDVVVPSLGSAANAVTQEAFRELVRRHARPVATDPKADVFEHDGLRVHAVHDAVRLRFFLRELLANVSPERIVVSTEDPTQSLLATALAEGQSRVVSFLNTVQMLPFGPAAFFPSVDATRRLQKVGRVLAVSEYATNYVRAHGGLIARRHYMPVYGPGPFPELGGNQEGFVTMTNPSAMKGIAILLAMADRLPNVRFAAVASWGTTSADRQALASRPNLTILEPEQDFHRILAKTRVLLMPSLWAETFGQTVVEAMLCGIPVLASDVGGIPEAKLGTRYLLPVRPITAYEQSLDENLLPVPIVPPQDIDPWVSALRELDDPATYRRESRASRDAAMAFHARLSSEELCRFLFEPVRPPAIAESGMPVSSRPALHATRLEALSAQQKALLVKQLQRQRNPPPGKEPPSGTGGSDEEEA